MTGTVELRGGDGTSAEVAGAVVYFVADGRSRKPPPIAAEITTLERRFIPQVLAVPVGSTVRFPNQDRIQHNVFSIAPGNRFDLGRYGRGPGHATTFKRPGLARIFCNVHRTMAAFVLVLETPFYIKPDAEGRFELSGLPSGSGTLHVFHPRAEPWERRIDVPAAGPVTVVLDATLPPVPVHLDKSGRPYRDGHETYR